MPTHRVAAWLLVAFFTCSVFCMHGVSAQSTLQSVTTYTNTMCSAGAKTVGVSAGLCYNHTMGDFLLTSVAQDPSPAWFAVGLYSDEGCATQTTSTADFANRCTVDAATGTSSVMRINTAWNVYFYSGCLSDCTNCTTVTKGTSASCFPTSSPGVWKKLVPLGIGTGAFKVQFFKSVDGSCANPVTTAPIDVPDSQCFGPHGLTLSSL